MEPTSPDKSVHPAGVRDVRTPALVVLLVVVGLALRLWGIGWGLPDARHPLATYHPDELVNLNAARTADILHGKFDIEFYNYGAFYFYIVDFAHIIGRGYGWIPATPPPQPGQAVSDMEQLVRSAPEMAGLFLTGRIVTAILGAATIAVLFALGNRLFGKSAGLTAALLYAVAPLAVVHAHFLTVDVPATFFVSLALLWAARLLVVPQKLACTLPGQKSETTREDLLGWREYLLAGAFCGLAAATKYNTGLVLIAPIVAHFLNHRPGACPKHRAAHLIVLLLIAAITFLVACPGPIINLTAFWEGTYPGSGLRYELFEHARQGHGELFLNTGPGWWYHLTVSLFWGLGLPLLLLSLAGIGLAFARRSRQDWILLSFLLIYYLSASFSAVRFARYMIPLYPVFCLLAARLVTEPFGQAFHRRAVAAVGVLITVLTLATSTLYVLAMGRPDPRDQAADYLEKSAKPGASIAFAKTPWYFSPPLSPLFGALRADIRARAAAETTRYQLHIPASEWDISVLSPSPDYVVLSDFETYHSVTRLHLPTAVQFVEKVQGEMGSSPQVFSGHVLFSEQFPDDLRYIAPTLSVYNHNTGTP